MFIVKYIVTPHFILVNIFLMKNINFLSFHLIQTKKVQLQPEISSAQKR